jgi:hypothetical protein
MSEFSDRPFVAGSLVGLRAFSVDALGRLTGPAYGGIFKPGENEAECLKRDDWTASYQSIMNSYSAAVHRMVWSVGPTAPTTSFDLPVSITPALQSSRGFGKSGRIRAAYDEANKIIETKSLAEEAVEREVPPTPPEAPPHSLAGIDCTCGFYAYFDGRNTYDEEGRVSAIIEGYGVCTLGSSGFRASKARLLALIEPDAKTPILKLKRNYPDVPWFEHEDAAMELFPLTIEHLPDPSADDFWTRGAK